MRLFRLDDEQARNLECRLAGIHPGIAQRAPRVVGRDGRQQSGRCCVDIGLKGRCGQPTVALTNVDKPFVNARQRAPIDLEVIPTRPKLFPPLEEGNREGPDAIVPTHRSNKDRICRHGRHRVAELAARLDQIVHPRKVLEDGGGCHPGTTGDVPNARADDSLLIVEGESRLHDPPARDGCRLGALAEPISPGHIFTAHIVR